MIIFYFFRKYIKISYLVYICAIVQVANTISASGNKFYLDADALLLNGLGEGTAEKEQLKKSGWGLW